MPADEAITGGSDHDRLGSQELRVVDESLAERLVEAHTCGGLGAVGHGQPPSDHLCCRYCSFTVTDRLSAISTR